MEQLTFDSRCEARGIAFERYRELYRPGTDVSRVGDEVYATLVARRHPGLLVFDRTLGGLAHERTQKRVLSDGFEHAAVQLVLDGRLGVTIGEERKWVGPGEIVAFDMRRPQRTWSEGVRHVSVSFQRELAEASLPADADFHGHVFASGAAPIVRDHIRALADCDAGSDLAMVEAVAATTGVLLGTLLGSIAAPAFGRTARAETKLRRAMAFIRLSVGRDDLSPTLVADRIGVSRSVLYRLFEPHGGVARIIQRQRLLAMRRALALDRRPISTIARSCGFVSDAHAGRSFRDAFGATPGQYRTQRRSPSGFDHWIADLQ